MDAPSLATTLLRSGVLPGEPALSAAARAALESLPIARRLSNAGLRTLAGGARLVTVGRGHVLFQRGDEPTGLYFVLNGTVKMLARSAAGKEKVVCVCGAGQMFGEVGVFLGGLCRAKAQTLSRCTLVHVDRDHVVAAVEQDGNLALQFLQELSALMQGLIDNVGRASARSAAGRVAAYLLDLAGSGRGAERQRLLLPAPKSAIASLLNLSSEAFSRVLRKLTAEQLIELHGRGVRILDAAGLRAVLRGA